MCEHLRAQMFEEEKQFRRMLQDLRTKKTKKEQLMNMVVEGLPDDHTQSIIDEIIAARERKLQELRQINMGISLTELRAQLNEDRLTDLREEVIEQLLDEGVADDELTLNMADERMTQLQNKQQESQDSASDLIFADVECILDSSNTFIPILICYTQGHDERIFHHWGTNCVKTFINTLLNWSKANKKAGRPYDFTIFFHNLKVSEIMATGTKMLHFKQKHLTVKDSLCFPNMPLNNFTKTFRLKELKKGWFPHVFKVRKFGIRK